MGSDKSRESWVRAATLCVVLGLSGCGSRPEAAAGTALTQHGADLKLENVAAKVGLRFTHRNSPRTPLTIVETMGSGCAYLDYNDDGWQDVFLVSAGTDFNNPKQPNESRLFRNDRGRFTDVTEASGIVVDGYA